MPDKCPRKPAKAAPARNDQQTAPESPVDMDSFRRDLSRRLSRIVGNRAKRWRTCGEPSCKRARSCCAPRGRCINPAPKRTMKPEHKARNLARAQRAIRDIGDAIEAQRAAQCINESHEKS